MAFNIFLCVHVCGEEGGLNECAKNHVVCVCVCVRLDAIDVIASIITET